jgi:O-antigen/teichoic acid export membrane protein
MAPLFSLVQTTLKAVTRRIRGEIAQALSGSILIQVGAGVASFAMLSLAARAMSAHDFGHLAMWLSISQMGSVFATFGQEMFVLRSLNEYTALDAPELAHGAAVFSLQIIAIIPALFGIGLFLAGYFLMQEEKGLMIAASLYLVANSVIAFGSHLARYAVKIMLTDGTRELLWKSLVVLFLLAIVAGRGSIGEAQFLFIACGALAIAITVQGIIVYRTFPRDVLATKPVWRFVEWMRTSSRFWATSILETLNQYFDVLVVYWLLDARSAGVYFVATRLANVFGTLLSAVHAFSTRRLPSLYFNKNTDEMHRVLISMAEVILLCVAGGLVVVWFGGDALLGLFGPSFADEKLTLVVLVLGTALYAAGGPAPTVMMIAGYEGRYPWILAASIALRLIGFAVLIPAFGLMGAAVAATISLLLTTVTLNVLCRRWTGIDPSVLTVLRNMRRLGPASPSYEAGLTAQSAKQDS